MNTNNNISIWRGSNPPPTQFHLWQKNNKLYHFDGIDWIENKVETASYENDGLMSKEDKERLDNLVYDGLDSTDIDKALSANQGNILLNKINDLKISAYKVKGSVENFDNLSTENLEIGDVYNILNSFYIDNKKYPEGTNVVWTGTQWDAIGGTVDFKDYSTTEEINEIITNLENNINNSLDNVNNSLNNINDQLDNLNNTKADKVYTDQQLETKVDKINGKGLSTNDYTTAEKTKLAGVEIGANKTVVDTTLSTTSTNPVQNKVVSAKLDTKVDKVTGKGLSTNDYTNAEKNLVTTVPNKANKADVDTQLATKVDKVAGKGLSTNDYTTDEKNKLAGIAAGAQVNTVTGVKGNSESSYRTGNINITPTNIGLGNIDNTSDLDKPVSTAQQTALDKKVDKVTGYGLSKNDFTDILKNKLDGIAEGAQVNSITGVKGSSEETYRTGNVSISASNIGLGNVNNTSDADKPISTAQQVALDEKVDKVSGKGLSTNDYTTDEKNKLAGIAAGAQVNVIESVKVNGATQPISNKEVNISEPTKLSQLTNDIYEIATSAEITAILN